MPDDGPLLLLTRPAAASTRFLAALRHAGARNRAIISPLIEVETLAPVLPDAPVSALILTSENGAKAAGGLGLPTGLRAYCVGDQTARVAEEGGFLPISAQGDADALVALILRQVETGPLWHLRGEHARGNVAARLAARGVVTRDLVVYRQHQRPLSPEARRILDGATPVVAPLFSPRTVSILTVTGPILAPLTVVAISQSVAAAAARLVPRAILLAGASDGPAMLHATIAALRGGAVLETGGAEG